MLRARLSNGTFLMGIDRVNVQRLRQGEPIVIDLTLMGGTDTMLIMYGETMEHIARELEKMTGEPLPPAQPYPGDEGPVQ